MRKVWFAVLTLAFLAPSVTSNASQLCTYGPVGCHSLSLPDIFQRVVQQSSRMHGMSNDLLSEYEKRFLPARSLGGNWKCHTYDIVTPGDKNNAQILGPEELTGVILRLLEAWGDPLSQLQRSLAKDQSSDVHRHRRTSSKAAEMSDMLRELRAGVVKMAEKMKLPGVSGSPGSPESAHPSPAFAFYREGDPGSVNHNNLLYCFRRDSSKVRNYLRVLQCTALPGLEC